MCAGRHFLNCWRGCHCWTKWPLPFQFDETFHESEEQKELAGNRLSELEKLQRDYQDCLRECEQLRLDVSKTLWSIASDAIVSRQLFILEFAFISVSVEDTARVCDRGDDRIQVFAVTILGSLQRINANEDTVGRSAAASADQQKHSPQTDWTDGGEFCSVWSVVVLVVWWYRL